MKKVIGVAAIFMVGAAAGWFVERQLRPEECVSEAALEGCETVATDMHNLLSDCQWELADSKHRLIEQLDRERELIKTFMPSAFE